MTSDTIPSAVALIDHVIEHVRAHPSMLRAAPVPLAEDTIAGLRMSDDSPLSPSLRRWLAFDAVNIALVTNGMINAQTVGQVNGWAFNTVERLLLPGACYPLFANDYDTTGYFLYGDYKDADGECPIFWTDIDDHYLLGLATPNFGVYLAMKFKAWDFNLYDSRSNPCGYRSLFDHPAFFAPMRAISHAIFRHFRQVDVMGDAIEANGAQVTWCSDADLTYDLRRQGFDDSSIEAMLGRTMDDL